MQRTRPIFLVCSLALLGAHAGCSAIGDPGGTPDGLPHGGTGQFRFLESTETGITSPLPGHALLARNRAIESMMAVEGAAFYAQANPVDEPPEVPMDHPPSEIYPPVFGPFAIYRGAARTEGAGTFEGGAMVLEASEPWEGGAVRDPWALVEDDGRVRLYYAAEGGIGLAEAPSIDGPFTKVDGPILPDARRPSVIHGLDGGYLMYFDAGDGIELAESADGRSFTVQGPVALEGVDETESPELRVGNPGAVRVETTADRTLVRLYFESFREDGAHRVYVAGSEDGVVFERHPREVMDNADIRFPSPVLVDTRVTFLYLNLPFVPSYQTRGVSVAVAPAGQRFDPPVP